MKLRFLVAVFFVLLAFPALTQTTEPTYDRIMKSGTIRCAYFIWPPFFSKDINTGKLSGIGYDIVEKIGQELSLKIDWVGEINFAAMFEGYASGRYDVVCGPIAPTPARSRVSDFTLPLFHGPHYLYARADDSRFDNNYIAANDPAIRYVGFDGEFSSIIARQDFPKAHYTSVPLLADPSQLFLTLTTKKADVTATEPVAAMEFMRKNPGQIKRAPGPPVRVLAGTFGIPLGEEKLKAMLNITIQSLLDTGYIDQVLKKHPDYDATLLRVAKPYEVIK